MQHTLWQATIKFGRPGQSKTETYEDHAKALFIKEPANMKLLIVVDNIPTLEVVKLVVIKFPATCLFHQ